MRFEYALGHSYIPRTRGVKFQYGSTIFVGISDWAVGLLRTTCKGSDYFSFHHSIHFTEHLSSENMDMRNLKAVTGSIRPDSLRSSKKNRKVNLMKNSESLLNLDHLPLVIFSSPTLLLHHDFPLLPRLSSSLLFPVSSRLLFYSKRFESSQSYFTLPSLYHLLFSFHLTHFFSQFVLRIIHRKGRPKIDKVDFLSNFYHGEKRHAQF